VLDDLGAELVPHHHVAGQVHREHAARAPGGGHELLGVLEGVEVGAADAAGERLDQHLARARLGGGQVGHHEAPAPHHGGTHGAHPTRVGVRSMLPAWPA
jgi:hypothetical protein